MKAPVLESLFNKVAIFVKNFFFQNSWKKHILIHMSGNTKTPTLPHTNRIDVRRCSIKKGLLKICNIHGKIPFLESAFNKVTGLNRFLTEYYRTTGSVGRWQDGDFRVSRQTDELKYVFICFVRKIS